METGGAKHPTTEVTETTEKATEAVTATEANDDPSLRDKEAGGESPYSPSAPLDMDSDPESRMDWEDSLLGVKQLFRQPPTDHKDKGVRQTVGKAGPELPEKEPDKETVETGCSNSLSEGSKGGDGDGGDDKNPCGGGGGNSEGKGEISGKISSGQGGCSGESGGGNAGDSSSGGGVSGSGDNGGDNSNGCDSNKSGCDGDKGARTSNEDRDGLANKVKNFLDRAKEKSVAEIKSRMARDTLIYEAISASNVRATVTYNLLGHNKMSSDQVQSFVELGDGRIMSGGMQLDMANKRIVSTSFTSEWKCLRCPQHTMEPALKLRGAADSSCHRQAIVLADQSFPAVLPVSGLGGCLKIILVESGSLDALYEELVKQVGNRRIPPGTLIMAFSASHLANIGICQYTRDLVSIASKIAAKYGSETIFQPLPPLLLGGTDSKPLIRSILELIAWSNSYYEGDNYLEKSQLMAKCIILEMGVGEQ
jgi:hypothetical protein